MKHRVHVSTVVLFASLILISVLQAEAPPSRFQSIGEITTIAEGLNHPDGLAIHPMTGELYIAERGAARIVAMRDGSYVPVIETGWSMSRKDLASWSITAKRTKKFLLEEALVEPGCIAFNSAGDLLIGENREYGRLIQFAIEDEYRIARNVAVPWLDKAYAWSGLKVDADDRIYLLGHDFSNGDLLPFGSILTRDLNKNWWAVDYGPFSHYTPMVLSRSEEILVFGDKKSGEIQEWDLVRKRPLSASQLISSGKECLTVGLLGDGSYVLAEKQKTRTGKGQVRLVVIDPRTAKRTILADGFQDVGDIALEPKSGALFLSDSKAGAVYHIMPPASLLSEHYRLVRPMLQDGENTGSRTNQSMMAIAPPQDKPETVSPGTLAKREKAGEGLARDVYTLKETRKDYPVIAGKIKTLPKEGVVDPVIEIEFVLYFPGSVVNAELNATPSLSFFKATRGSGKEERTRLLFEDLAADRKIGEQWVRQSNQASIYVPLISCGVEKRANSMDLNVAFLGLSIFDDYYLNISTDRGKSGTLLVEGKFGEKTLYQLDMSNKQSNRPVLYVLKEEKAYASRNLEWLQIGKFPPGRSVITGAEIGEMQEMIMRFPQAGEILRKK